MSDCDEICKSTEECQNSFKTDVYSGNLIHFTTIANLLKNIARLNQFLKAILFLGWANLTPTSLGVLIANLIKMPRVTSVCANMDGRGKNANREVF